MKTTAIAAASRLPRPPINLSLKLAAPAALAALLALAPRAAALDFYYNSFRNNNGNTETAGNKYYTYYDGTHTLYTSPGTWFFTSATFVNTYRTETGTATHGDSSIYVDANGVPGEAVFYGTNIYVHSERAAASENQAVSVRNRGIVYLFSSTLEKVNTSDNDSEGIYIGAQSLFHGEDITLTVTGPRNNGANIASDPYNRLELDRAFISTTGAAAGLTFTGNGAALLASATIRTTGNHAPGVQFNTATPYLEYKGGSIHATGSGSPGIWAGISNASTHVVASISDLDILSDQSFGLAINTHLNNTRAPDNTAFNDNNGIYEFSFENSAIAGALGSVRVTSAATRRAGTTFYEIPTRLILKLNHSTLTGDITALSQARLDLDARSTTLDGDLRAEGDATINATFADSAITGAITAAGGAALDLALDRTTIARGIELSGSATAILRLANSSTLAGAVSLYDDATLDARLDASSRLSDNLFIDRGATLRFAVSGATATFPGITLLGNLHLAAKTTLTGPLVLGSDATITLTDVSGDDLTLGAGVTGAGLLAIQSIATASLGQPEIRVIADQTGAMAPDAFTLAGGAVDRGLISYTLETRDDGAWLVGGAYSPAFGAIYNTRAAAAIDFFQSLAPVHDHLAALRTAWRAPPASSRGSSGPPVGSSGSGGTLWASVRADALRADADTPFPAFKQTTAGLIVGGDTRAAAAGSLFTIGWFGDISRVDRDFTRGADGATTSYAAGPHASWLHPAGWFASASARFDSQKHTFHAAGLSADYRTHALGASLELGRRLATPARAWWFEPSLQAALFSLQSAAYTAKASDETISDVDVRAAALRATRYRAQVRAGWNPSSGPLRLHAALACVADDTTGGEIGINAEGDPLRRVLEGRHVEAALGCAYVLGRGGLHLGFAATLGDRDDYTLPWRLSLGYTRAW
jgi:outer membrane autotransporter protein